MKITEKQFYKIKPLLLCGILSDFKGETMINDCPDDIGELSLEKFISAEKYADLYYSAELINIFSEINKKTLFIKKTYVILKTAKHYIEQMNRFYKLIENIGEKFKIPSKACVSLQDDYSWMSLIDILTKGDVSKVNDVKKLSLYDFILFLKLELDKNYSAYLKMKTN